MRALSGPDVAVAEREGSREERLAARVGLLTPEQRNRLAQALKERGARAPTTVPRRTEPGPAPPSYSPDAPWFLEQWDPRAPTNHGVPAPRVRRNPDAAGA